jgi:hypothetical protein
LEGHWSVADATGVGLRVGTCVGELVRSGAAGTAVALGIGLAVSVRLGNGVALGLGVHVIVGSKVGVPVFVQVADTKRTSVGDTYWVAVRIAVGRGVGSPLLICQRTIRLASPMQYMHSTVRMSRANAK